MICKGTSYVSSSRTLPQTIGILKASATNIEESVSSDFQVYPNPANAHLTLLLSNNSSKMEIEIYNLLGEKQISLQVTEQQTTIDIANLAAGVYMIELRSENKISRQKFIKQN